jgi:50S ribosomal subunit-associated GTPase HflX
MGMEVAVAAATWKIDTTVVLEAFAKIASSMEGEIQVEIHHDEVTSPVREKGASSKKL